MPASCLGDPALMPEVWDPVPPELHPVMKEFSTAVKNAHKSLVEQASKPTDKSICDIMKTTWMKVIKARHALDCGSTAAISSGVLGSSDHEAILEATRSCIGSDDLCLIKKLGYHVNTSSLGPVCSALREVGGGLLTAMGIFCHEELGSSSCSYWKDAECGGAILAAAAACTVTGPGWFECISAALGVGSTCIPCICGVLPKNPFCK